MQNLENIPLLCGIDTLYYFVETNHDYDDFFLDLLDQIEDKKALFERREIEYTNKDIFINLQDDISLQYLNNAEGFYWFKDFNEYFRIGFKDEFKNRQLHNIRVQLQGLGIYTIGLKPLISFVNDTVLKEITTGLYPITRADINCFINYDFSSIDKSMFASRKKRYMSISEFGSANSIQTLYVGKAPFMLRLYDKKKELEKSAKKELMYEYFANNDLDINESIFNVEYEMHRTHLRAFDVKTLDDLLLNANNLFKKAMEDIRLIDTATITENDIKNNSKSRAETQKIWLYIKDHFDIKEFLQLDFPIKRLKRKTLIYDESRFIDDMKILLKKGFSHGVEISSKLLELITDEFLEEQEEIKAKRKKDNAPKCRYTPVAIQGDKQEYRLLQDGEVIKPVNTIPFRHLTEQELEQEIMDLENGLYFGENKDKIEVSKKLKVAYEEKLQRKKR